MKKELLAPAGDMDSLKEAIKNGADAVYLAGTSFGARKFAKNFSNEELVEAINYAHVYGVKIYVTVNTIIFQDEIEDCLNYLTFLYNNNVDAVIVQDLGLIKLIRKYLPNLEIHASTQAHTHNIMQIKLLEKLGVKRVVLAREMSIDEINKLDTSMELEIFIHGALCICYSGQCLFSSGVLNRSGNRGECAGLCRIPYNLIRNDKEILNSKYLLSPKEFNTTNYISLLKKSKVFSFKIEGRMKSPEYVGYVTSIYRKLLDNDNYSLSEAEIYNLKSLYNRGFTKGFLFNNSDSEFISLNSSNHQGVKVGEILEVNKKKIKVKLTNQLYQNDAVRFPNGEGMYVNFLYNEKDMLVSNASSGDIVYLDNKVDLNKTGDLFLTVNSKLISDLKNRPDKKLEINANIYAHQNEPLKIVYSDGLNEVSFIGDIVEKAKNSPITKERIIEILGKLGNTPFVLKDVKCNISDSIFLPVGVINEIRRNLVEELINKRIAVKHNVKLDVNNKVKGKDIGIGIISALARNEEQVKTLLDLNITDIYVTDINLYQKFKDKVILRTDRVIDKHEMYKNEKLLIGESGGVFYTDNNLVYSDYYLNVVNHATVNLLKEFGVKRICLSPELSLDRTSLLCKNVNDPQLEVIVYGKLEYMIMKYNMKENMNLDNAKYYLEDKNKRRYQIVSDKFTHLMSNEVINKISLIPELKQMGIDVFRIELFDENSDDIKKIISNIRDLM